MNAEEEEKREFQSENHQVCKFVAKNAMKGKDLTNPNFYCARDLAVQAVCFGAGLVI